MTTQPNDKTKASFSKVDMTITLTLTEDEARALHTITSYGSDPFLQWFYRNLGKHYMKPHEKGLISLFDTVKKELPGHFAKMETVRKALEK